jgi:predicted ferric reductase
VAAEGGIVRLALTPHPRLNYRPGQFAFLRFRHPELRGEEHPFSFTSATHENEVGFAVRELGDFTSRLTRLRPGDRVRVNGGFGAFRPNRGTEPLALIGSGIGAAPLVSILKDLNLRHNDREVLCLMAVTRRNELLDPSGLQSLRQTMPNLTLKVFISEEGGVLYGDELFAREIPDPKRYRYYLCSSGRVRQVVTDSLRKLGVKRRRIHYEAFQLG